MIALLAFALAAPSVDGELALGFRYGLAAHVNVPVRGPLVFTGSAVAKHPIYGISGPDFPRRTNVRVGLLPGIGLQSSFGRRDRWDVFSTWHLGPELYVVDETVVANDGAVTATYRHNEVILVSGLRFGVHARVSDRVGVVTSVWSPMFSGPGGYRIERLHLGVGVHVGPRLGR